MSGMLEYFNINYNYEALSISYSNQSRVDTFWFQSTRNNSITRDSNVLLREPMKCKWSASRSRLSLLLPGPPPARHRQKKNANTPPRKLLVILAPLHPAPTIILDRLFLPAYVRNCYELYLEYYHHNCMYYVGI